MVCEYQVKIRIEVEKEFMSIIREVFLPDALKEGWKIYEEGGTLVIEISPLNSEAQVRGVINSILRQLEVLYKVLSEL